MGDSPSAPAPVDNGPMLAMIAQMQAQQAQALQDSSNAQKQALVTSQDTAAQQAARQSGSQMQQNLGMLNASQQAKDAAALQRNQQLAAGAGGAVTGSGLDLNAANAAKLANLGAGASLLPTTPANVVGSASAARNPALTTAGSTPANTFSMPQLGGLKFGGA